MTTTAQLNDTIVQLESLYNAYNEILDSAKTQLEDLQMTDEDVKNLAAKIGRLDGFRDETANAVYRKVLADLKEGDESLFESYLNKQVLAKLAERLMDLVKKEIAEYIDLKVNQIVDSYKVERALSDKLKENDAINSALAIQKAVSQIIKDTVKDD